MNEIFVDGVAQIHYVGGMIRIDFVTAQPNGDGNTEQIETKVCERVIMTPQGFINMLGTMTQLSEQLVEGGVFGKEVEAEKKATKTTRKKKD